MTPWIEAEANYKKARYVRCESQDADANEFERISADGDGPGFYLREVKSGDVLHSSGENQIKFGKKGNLNSDIVVFQFGDFGQLVGGGGNSNAVRYAAASESYKTADKMSPHDNFMRLYPEATYQKKKKSRGIRAGKVRVYFLETMKSMLLF